jgi:hypothetical protein
MQQITEESVGRMSLQPGLKEQIRKAELKGTQGRYNDKGEWVDPIGAPSEGPAADGDAPMPTNGDSTLIMPVTSEPGEQVTTKQANGSITIGPKLPPPSPVPAPPTDPLTPKAP